MKTTLPVLSTLLLLLFFSCKKEISKNTPLETQIISQKNGKQITDNWGTLSLHLDGHNTYGTENIVMGVANIKAGQEIHPPHTHEEEEFLYVTKGSGIWNVLGRETPAKKGDILYAEPWKLHGIKNTGKEEMEFFFFKWNNKGIPLPQKDKFKSAIGSLSSQILFKSQGKLITENWGDLSLYTNEASTYGMEKMVSGIANIKAGQEIHPPHKHEEEEFLYVVSGSGEWTINDEIITATTGDLLYAKPNDLHGITNTGSETLTFYFIKWNNKGIDLL